MLQGFWSALGEENASTFGKLLTLCDEFSVKLDYSTPVSGGEWVVTVAHFGDRTEFRFPRLGFNVREAVNTLEQRLIKAEKKLGALREAELAAAAPAPSVSAVAVISEDSATLGESAPSLSGDAGQITGSLESKDAPAAIEAEGKSESSDSTPVVAGSPSDAGIETESPKNTTSSAKDAPVDVTPKPEASSPSVSDKSHLNKTKRG